MSEIRGSTKRIVKEVQSQMATEVGESFEIEGVRAQILTA